MSGPFVTKKEMKQFYDSHSDYYPRSDLQIVEKVLNDLENYLFSEHKNLLEVGCGSGDLSIILSKKGFHSVGIDISKIGISKAQENKEKGQECSFIVGDGEFLPIKSNSFYYLTCINMIEHLVHPEKCINEIARVTKPKGVVILQSPNSPFAAFYNSKLASWLFNKSIIKRIFGYLGYFLHKKSLLFYIDYFRYLLNKRITKKFYKPTLNLTEWGPGKNLDKDHVIETPVLSILQDVQNAKINILEAYSWGKQNKLRSYLLNSSIPIKYMGPEFTIICQKPNGND